MNKDWFPFFSTLFWCFTKMAGLCFLAVGLTALTAQLASDIKFRPMPFRAILPTAIGGFLLVNDTVYDLATAEQRRRLGQNNPR